MTHEASNIAIQRHWSGPLLRIAAEALSTASKLADRAQLLAVALISFAAFLQAVPMHAECQHPVGFHFTAYRC
jgi:hypothetical protein